jgi:DNA recombination protein RmuC
MAEAALVLVALVVGIGIGWFAWGRRATVAADELRSEIELRATAEAALAAERRESEEKLKLLEGARKALSDAFEALAAQALKSNSQTFLQLANQSIEAQVKPVKDGLAQFDAKIAELEKARTGAYAGLTEQVRSLLEAQSQLRSETSNLVQALRSPVVRGRWGEIQLRRVVEMAGMLNHCDFYEQESAQTETGRQRPDVVVRLPAGKTIVVDAKAPITSYLDAVNLTDPEARKAKLADFAKLVRAHVTALGRKTYWEQFDPSPELVVMFLPGEHFFGAAAEQDPALIEYGVDQKVIIATPTTLISLLRAVAYGWRQEAIAQNAKEISALAAELYKRLSDMGAHWADLGDALGKSVDAYNRAVGALETRVLVSARKFKELGATPEAEIKLLSVVERAPREPRAPEMAERKKPI